MILMVDKYVNMLVVFVLLVFGEGLGDGWIKLGDLVLFEVMGGGLIWGGVLVCY